MVRRALGRRRRGEGPQRILRLPEGVEPDRCTADQLQQGDGRLEHRHSRDAAEDDAPLRRRP